MNKIALLIPCTSKGRPEWNSIKDTYLFNYSLKSFLLTQNPEYNYEFHIGYDYDDRIFSLKEQQDIINKFSLVFKNIQFFFTPFTNISKGHVTKMWNVLFKNAYDNECDYFYQCGDDISFKTKNWVKDSIEILKNNDDIGLSGPINNNNRILTQAMVSRKHMEIFGWFFPEEIINWCCDDWYNWVYQPNHFYPLNNHFCSNDGGNPRYDINNNSNFKNDFRKNTENLRKSTFELAQTHKRKIDFFIKYKMK
jgi:hypothetical protein